MILFEVLKPEETLWGKTEKNPKMLNPNIIIMAQNPL